MCVCVCVLCVCMCVCVCVCVCVCMCMCVCVCVLCVCVPSTVCQHHATHLGVKVVRTTGKNKVSCVVGRSAHEWREMYNVQPQGNFMYIVYIHVHHRQN